jgi:phage I-like protein
MNNIKRLGLSFKLSEEATPLVVNHTTGPIIKDLQILKSGSFYDPRYSDFIITEMMLSEMVSNFKSGVRGVIPALDYAHETDGPAAGWFKELYLKDGDAGKELWGKVEFTPRGQKSLSDKDYAYLSADFDESYSDNESGTEYGCVFLGAALTNRPVIKRMTPAIQLSEKNDPFKEKVAKLIKEGYPQEQALAIAYDMQDKGKLNEGEYMKPEDKKLAAPAEGEKSPMEKMCAEVGVASPEELMKLIAELKAKIAELEGAKKAPEKPEAEPMEMGEMKKQLSEVRKELDEARKEKELAVKTNEFTKLLSEGKAVEAQRESFLKGDMAKFIELAQPIKLSESGSAATPKTEVSGDIEDQILVEAKKLSEEKKIDMGKAISEVIKNNKQLAEKLNK